MSRSSAISWSASNASSLTRNEIVLFLLPILHSTDSRIHLTFRRLVARPSERRTKWAPDSPGHARSMMDRGSLGTGHVLVAMNERGESVDRGLLDEVEALLDEIGFDPERSVLTRRQAQVLVLREQGESQAAIADAIGSSRANVSSIEASGRENVERSRETVAFADALHAPVRVNIDTGTDLYDVPQQV